MTSSAAILDGYVVIDKPWVQQNLARLYAKVQVLRLMNWKQAWAATKGQPNMADSSSIKVFGSELSLEAYRASWRSRSDMMVVDPSSEFFKAMRGAAPTAEPRR